MHITKEKLKEILEREAREIWKRASYLATDMRRGACIVALERLSAALHL